MPAGSCFKVQGPSRELSRVARNKLSAPFFRGFPPVETDLGESCKSGPSIERSTVFPAANYWVIKRENLADQNHMPRFLIGACSGLVSLSNRTVCGSLSLKRRGRRKDYSLLIPSRIRVSCRELPSIHNFQQKISPDTMVFAKTSGSWLGIGRSGPAAGDSF